MGWDFCEVADKQSTIGGIIMGWSNDTGHTYTCLAHRVIGNTVWTVWEVVCPSGQTDRFIGCDRIRKDRKLGWGHNGMSEVEHPFYYDCPLKFLDMVPYVRNKDWRNKVREYHNDKKNKVMRGTRRLKYSRYRIDGKPVTNKDGTVNLGT